MKAKITNKSKLFMKGIAVVIIFTMMFSIISSIQTVFADEIIDISEEYDNIEDINTALLVRINTTIEELKNQLRELDNSFDYDRFVSNINSLQNETNKEIKISNELELRALSAYVQEGHSCEGYTFVLTKSIALSSIEWNPIGTRETNFKGTFDGAGFTISGITITQKQTGAGFIGYSSNATIRNLKIGKSSINITPEVDNVTNNDLASSGSVNYSYLGAILGYGTNTTIINCINTANVNGGNCVGGIVGYLENGDITNCSNSGYVGGYINVGGIVGIFKRTENTASQDDVNRKVSYCKNEGEVFSIIGNAGGIIGWLEGKVFVERCLNSGSVETNEAIVKTPYHANETLTMIPENVGGIVGWASGYHKFTELGDGNDAKEERARIYQCINDENARIYGYQDIGGIVGQLGGYTTNYTTARAENCINYSKSINCTIEYSEPFGKRAGQIAGACGIASGIKITKNASGQITGATCSLIKSFGEIAQSYYYVDNIPSEYDTNPHRSTNNSVKAYGYRIQEGSIDGDRIVISLSYNKQRAQENLRYLTGSKGNRKYYANIEGEGGTYTPTLITYNGIGSTPDFRVITNISEENTTYSIAPNAIDLEKIDVTSPKVQLMVSEEVDGVQTDVAKEEIIITNSGAPTLAVKGDILTVKVPFSEYINVIKGTPILKLKFDNINERKQATFKGIGEDSKSLIFEYQLTGEESGKISSVSLESLKDYVADTFNNTQNQTNYNVNNIIKALALNETINNMHFIKSNNGANITYDISSPSYQQQDNNFYFKKGDIIKVVATLGGEITNAVTDIDIPVLHIKIGNTRKDVSTDNIRIADGTIEYTFTAEDNGLISDVYLTTQGNIKYGPEGNEINRQLTENFTKVRFSDDRIYVDTILPQVIVNLNVSNANEANRYKEGEEITINVSTLEPINLEASIKPEINVSFSESGYGKYNNNEDSNIGNAKYISTIANKDDNDIIIGYTYVYRYIIQNGDEGTLLYNFANQNGKIVDIAGNEIRLEGYTEPTHVGDVTLEGKLTDIQKTGVSYKIYKNGRQLSNFNNNTYFATGDTIKVVAETTNILYSSWGSSNIAITAETAPKLKIDGITNDISAQSVSGKRIVYEYTITDNNNDAQLSKLNLKTTSNLYTQNSENNFETIPTGTINSTDITNANLYIHQNTSIVFNNSDIYVDTTAPRVKIVAKYDFNEDGKVDYSDVILLNRFLDLLVLDSNPETNERIKNRILEDGDVSRDQLIDIQDLTILQRIILGVEGYPKSLLYKFIWSEEVQGFTNEDIVVNGGVKGSLSNPINNNDGTVVYTMEIEPSVEAGNIGELQVIIEQDAVQDLVGLRNIKSENIMTIDRKSPTVEIRADKDVVSINDIITYTINWSESIKDFTSDMITIIGGEIVAGTFSGSGTEYTVQVKSTNGNDLSVEVKDNVCTDISGNGNIGNKHVIGVKPTVEIIPVSVENSITNKDEITYTFKWSEEVEGFALDDITVNNGIKGALSNVTVNEDGTYSYTMKITTSVENGNLGELQVIVEEDAVQDLVGLGNVRTESVIRVDKQSPILISLEAYANSNAIDTADVSQVKESYKSGDTVTIVATFSENIENSEIPTLTLQFSESGYANGDVNPGVKEGNKITYTYTINEQDKGTLTVAEFTGIVIDAAGNETVVTKRALDGNTVNADSEAPKLVGVTAIAPEFAYEDLIKNGETRRYGKGTEIKFVAEFYENVYSYANRTINNITSSTAPELNFKFGDASRKATFSKVNGKTIEYTYTIGENNNNDNGSLSFVNISGTDAKAIYDIAGNSATGVTSGLVEYLGDVKLEGNEHIIADTTAPSVSLEVTSVENSEITSLNNNYKAGTVLTITATSNEYMYNKSGENLSTVEADLKNALSIKFGETAVQQNTITCIDVTYENNKTVFTYEYVIRDGNNGAIELSFASEKYYDIAFNKNATGETARDSIAVMADTENPYYYDQPGIEFSDGKYTVTFNENLYYLDENNIVRTFGNIEYAPTLKFENEDAEYLARVSGNVITYTGAYVNAKPYLSASRLCDAAGNLYSYFDQVAPEFKKIEVTSPVTGTYSKGQEVTIVATFDENITATTLPTLKLQFSKSEDAKGRVSGEIQENTIVYTYTINEQDEGVLTLKDFTGTVKDIVGNETVLAKKDLQGYVITADSIAPKLTITSDVENERTNKNKIIYTFTWDEPVRDFEASDIEVLNGSKGNFIPSNDGKVYTLEVYTANEGRQIVTVPVNSCTDVAGNSNDEAVVMSSVFIDFTKPEVRAKVNGGNYVVDTDSQKSTLRETLVVNEEISKFEYVWSSSTTTPTTWESLNISNIDINNDIQLETDINKSSVGDNGTPIYLYIKVTDKAGNEAVGRTNAFVVRNERITFQSDVTETTSSNVTVTVNYGDKGLTQNKRAGIQGISQSADANTVILSENGTVYAEASDIAGNKVYGLFEVSNIDKTTSLEITSITKNTNDPADSVIITVNAECIGSEIDGYSIDNGNTWQKANTFTITNNGTYTILVKDKTGNQANDSIVISNIRQAEDNYFRITNYTKKTESNVKYVVGISTYTSLRDFKQYIQTNMTYTIYDRKGNVVTDNDIVATDMKIRVSNGDEYILVVIGDLNSDGKADISDLSALASYYIGKASLTTPYKLAADIVNNGTIDISDISALARAVVQKIRL